MRLVKTVTGTKRGTAKPKRSTLPSKGGLRKTLKILRTSCSQWRRWQKVAGTTT